jgi:hypothetical protein
MTTNWIETRVSLPQNGEVVDTKIGRRARLPQRAAAKAPQRPVVLSGRKYVRLLQPNTMAGAAHKGR